MRSFADPLRRFGPNNGTGGAALFPSDDPNFFSGYAEIGLFLTGESRGYRAGRWDRTKVRNPFGNKGIGAFQINARIDHSDFRDRAGSALIDGGKMISYAASLIWYPSDYVKFIAQYNNINVTGGPGATPPFTVGNSNDYGIDLFALRAQLDF